jgi:hypothetical protein
MKTSLIGRAVDNERESIALLAMGYDYSLGGQECLLGTHKVS